LAVKIQIRNGLSTEWTSVNPVLMQGELGLELDTGKFKAGDGTKTWSLLAYSTGGVGPAGIQGPVGTTGATLYTWIKYADTPTTGISDDPTGKKYFGMAYNKSSATKSLVYTDYSWSLTEGIQGIQGIQGLQGGNVVLDDVTPATNKVYSSSKIDSSLAAQDNRLTDLESRSIKTYGARRTLGATSPVLTRIYDAIGKVANMPINDSVVVDDFENIFPWSHIKECKIVPITNRVVYKGEPGYDLLTADWMVEIPKFYLNITQDATNRDISISQYRQKGFWTPQVFKTEAGVELDKIYVARFKTGKAGTTDVSRPSLFAENGRDLASFRTGAKAKGIGWQLTDLSFVQEVLYPLYSIEAATLHSQSYLGDGLTTFRYVATDTAQIAQTAVNRIVILNTVAGNYNVGEGVCIGTAQGAENIAFDRAITAKNQLDATNTEIIFDGAPVNIAVGNVLWQGAQKTGQTVNLVKPSGKLPGVGGRTSFKYRGMEDSFGNVYEWVDGVLINNNVAQICRKPSLYASTLTADYKPAGYANSNTNGYPTEMGFDNNFPEARFPISIGAGTTTGYCDYYYQDAGLRGVFFGGTALDGTVAGLFFWYLLNPPSSTSWGVGSRLLYKPSV